MAKEYRIVQVGDKFEIHERDAGTKKHFKLPYYNRGTSYNSLFDAEEALDYILKLSALTDEELNAACPF